jgi:hypothetical protein
MLFNQTLNHRGISLLTSTRKEPRVFNIHFYLRHYRERGLQ